MPFKNNAQMRALFAKKPGLARKWVKEMKEQGKPVVKRNYPFPKGGNFPSHPFPGGKIPGRRPTKSPGGSYPKLPDEIRRRRGTPQSEKFDPPGSKVKMGKPKYSEKVLRNRAAGRR